MNNLQLGIATAGVSLAFFGHTLSAQPLNQHLLTPGIWVGQGAMYDGTGNSLLSTYSMTKTITQASAESFNVNLQVTSGSGTVYTSKDLWRQSAPTQFVVSGSDKGHVEFFGNHTLYSTFTIPNGHTLQSTTLLDHDSGAIRVLLREWNGATCIRFYAEKYSRLSRSTQSTFLPRTRSLASGFLSTLTGKAKKEPGQALWISTGTAYDSTGQDVAYTYKLNTLYSASENGMFMTYLTQGTTSLGKEWVLQGVLAAMAQNRIVMTGSQTGYIVLFPTDVGESLYFASAKLAASQEWQVTFGLSSPKSSHSLTLLSDSTGLVKNYLQADSHAVQD